jgi:hypothetical protein
VCVCIHLRGFKTSKGIFISCQEKYKERVISDLVKVIRGIKEQIKNIYHFLSKCYKGEVYAIKE